MSDLYPTKTRIALLRDVDDGTVVYSANSGVLNTATLPPTQVLDAVIELRQAGWIAVDFSRGTLGSYPYVLTDTGRAVLDAAP